MTSEPPQTESPTDDAQFEQRLDRHPRFVDRLATPRSPWLVAPRYESTPDATRAFADNVRAELARPDALTFVVDEAVAFLESLPTEAWDVTRDIPCVRPVTDINFWEWRVPPPEGGKRKKLNCGSQKVRKSWMGVLCKGVGRATLAQAIAEFTAIQEQGFDYDVALALQSAVQAEPLLPPQLDRSPVSFFVGTIFSGVVPLYDGNAPRPNPLNIRPVGSFALTSGKDGHPLPDSLALMVWDDNDAPGWESEVLENELRDGVRIVCCLHTLMRALETITESVIGDDELRAYQRVNLRNLPDKLKTEGFAVEDGLIAAFRYMRGKFRAPDLQIVRE